MIARSVETLTVDCIVSATGFRPDHAIASELRLDLDPIMESTRALAPLIDPNEHSTAPSHHDGLIAYAALDRVGPSGRVIFARRTAVIHCAVEFRRHSNEISTVEWIMRRDAVACRT